MYKPNKVQKDSRQEDTKSVTEQTEVSDVFEVDEEVSETMEDTSDMETFSVSSGSVVREKILGFFGKVRDSIKAYGTGAWVWVAAIVLVIVLAIFAVVKLAAISANKSTRNGETGSETDNTVETTVTAETMSDEDFFSMLGSGDFEETADEEIFTYMTIDRPAVFANESAVGRLKINGTDVDYTVVQATDNAYYLDKDENGSESESGAIYGDYRNDFNQLDRNNVIYGHNMASGAMFGTLSRMLTDSFYEDNDGFIYFDSQYFNNVFEVYSVYEIDLQSFCYIQTGFKDATEFDEFIDKTQELNMVETLKDKVVPEDTYLLTLSTCIEGGTKRLVVHGFLYAREIT